LGRHFGKDWKGFRFPVAVVSVMVTDTKQIQEGRYVRMKPLVVGVCFDTRDDFRFVSEQPQDWDAEFSVRVSPDIVAW